MQLQFEKKFLDTASRLARAPGGPNEDDLRTIRATTSALLSIAGSAPRGIDLKASFFVGRGINEDYSLTGAGGIGSALFDNIKSLSAHIAEISVRNVTHRGLWFRIVDDIDQLGGPSIVDIHVCPGLEIDVPQTSPHQLQFVEPSNLPTWNRIY